MKDNLPISSFDRTKSIVKSAIKISGKKTMQFSKRAFLSTENYTKEKEKINNEIAIILFENISLLKGTAVKITQALVLHNILPTTIQKELSKSYNQIKPINQVLIMKVLKNEFKKEYSAIFKKFNLKPFASASLGQVHLAITENDKQIAVKIQYPSIDKTIQNDIKLIKKLISFKKNILSIIEEVEEKLYEEIDYEKEMKNNLWAYENFNSKDIIVPKVYEEYCTQHILTTSFIKGLDLYSWLLTNPKQRYKTIIANNMFDTFTKSIFKYKKIQADPNPANYIITSENKLALIDFGCVKSFEKKFIQNYINIFKVYNSTDKNEILKFYKKIGCIQNIEDITDDIFKTKILPFNKWAIEPFLKDEYTFTKEYLNKGVKYADMFLNKPFLVVKDFIFLDRVSHGLFSLFEQMNAVIDMRTFREYLDFDDNKTQEEEQV